MRVDDINPGRHLSPSGGPQRPRESHQGAPAEGSSQTGRKRFVIGQSGGEAASHRDSPYRYSIHLGSACRAVTGHYDAYRNTPAQECAGQQAQGRTGRVAWPTGVTVGQKNDPHRSIPDVVLL
jgi:hypothetical protein